MKNNIHSEIDSHLGKDETILWIGKPKSGLVFRVSDLLAIPMSIIWLGFAIFLTIAIFKSGAIFWLVGIPFIILGVYYVIGRFIADIYLRKNTIYTITNRRIIIKSGVFYSVIDSINIRQAINVTLLERKDGTGTISIGEEKGIPPWLRGFNNPGFINGCRLELVENPKKIYSLIVEIMGE